MIRRPPPRLALPAALAAAILAGPVPAAARDGRVVTQRFTADEIVRIPGRQGIQATIAFAEDERIENVAIGDANAWQVTPNKRANLLFVKPLLARAQTNLTVVTDRHTYLFDLLAGPGATPLYVLRFSYPAQARTAAARRPGAAPADPALTEEEARAAAGAVSEPTPDPAALNFAWRQKGKRNLLPARIYDDGQATFIAWAPGSAIPAMQIRNEAGVEGPVNFAVRDDVIVIDGVPGVIVLRSGRDMAILERGADPRQSGLAPASAQPRPANALAAAQPGPAMPASPPPSASSQGQ